MIEKKHIRTNAVNDTNYCVYL